MTETHPEKRLIGYARTLAQIVQLDDTAPDMREQASRTLENATLQLPAISEKLQ